MTAGVIGDCRPAAGGDPLRRALPGMARLAASVQQHDHPSLRRSPLLTDQPDAFAGALEALWAGRRRHRPDRTVLGTGAFSREPSSEGWRGRSSGCSSTVSSPAGKLGQEPRAPGGSRACVERTAATEADGAYAGSRDPRDRQPDVMASPVPRARVVCGPRAMYSRVRRSRVMDPTVSSRA